jgi:hypothetical protein
MGSALANPSGEHVSLCQTTDFERVNPLFLNRPYLINPIKIIGRKASPGLNNRLKTRYAIEQKTTPDEND